MGSSFIALKIAFAELSPMWVIFGHMLLGSLVFIAAWRWRGRIEYRRGDWKYLLSLAILRTLPCTSSARALALQNTKRLANQHDHGALLPLLVAVGAFIFLRERICRMSLAGFLIAVAGAVWLSLAGTADEHAPNRCSATSSNSGHGLRHGLR